MEITASAPFERESRRADWRRWLLRAGSIALTLLVAGAWFQFLRPSSIGGPATYVIVSGTSMLPTLGSGDLAVAFREDSYEVGDIVVYRVPGADPGAGTQIVHRIVGHPPNGIGYLVQGDNREGPDYWHPTDDEVLGKMQLRVPQAGSLLATLKTPFGMGALAAALTTFLIAVGVSTGPSRQTDEE